MTAPLGTESRIARNRGLTQVEVVISAVLLTIIAGSVTVLMQSGVDTYGIGMSKGEIERQAARVLEILTEELSMSGDTVISPQAIAPSFTDNLTYQKNTGWNGTGIIWGPTQLLELRYDPGDPNDGVDNNGNGLVDECILVLTTDVGGADEREVVLTRWVREYLEGEEPNSADDNGNGVEDERGFSLDVVGTVWNVRLTLERHDATGRLVTHTVETSVRPRND